MIGYFTEPAGSTQTHKLSIDYREDQDTKQISGGGFDHETGNYFDIQRGNTKTEGVVDMTVRMEDSSETKIVCTWDEPKSVCSGAWSSYKSG